MPIYEYACSSCGTEKEVLKKMSDPSDVLCDACATPMDKKVSAAGFRLKGNGWYETDFKGSSSPKKNLASSGDSSSNSDSSGSS